MFLRFDILLLSLLTLVCIATIHCPEFDHTIPTTRGKTKLLYVSTLGVGDQLKWVIGYPVNTHVMSAKFTDQAVPIEGVENK